MLENPHVGLIFLLPGRRETLRVNRRAWITKDEELLATMLASSRNGAALDEHLPADEPTLLYRKLSPGERKRAFRRSRLDLGRLHAHAPGL